MAIKAVLFDYGLVLTGPQDEAAMSRMQALLGANAEDFEKVYWKYRDGYDRGVLTGTAYWTVVAGELGRELSAEDLSRLMRADVDRWTQPNEPMVAWAVGLRQAGLKTGILSNLGDAMEAGIMQRFEWLREFSHRTFSHRLGIAKPDAAIYRFAANGLGVAPEEMLFIDDREENVKGARAIGMSAIQYGGLDEFEREMEQRGLGWLLQVGRGVSTIELKR